MRVFISLVTTIMAMEKREVINVYQPTNKILRFRAGDIRRMPRKNRSSTKPKAQTLHPLVRRRRLFWLCLMVLFLIWFAVELIVQQMAIWEREERLLSKQNELQVAQAETKSLQSDMKMLRSPDYLLELAHKMGYSKDNEENYRLPKKKTD